jgi:hypothetical protein
MPVTSKLKKVYKHVDPPASPNLLNALYNQVLEKSFKNLNVTLVSFRGSGKTSELKFLLKNPTQMPKNRLFILLDLNFATGPQTDEDDQFFRDALIFLQAYFKQHFSNSSSGTALKLALEQKITQDAFNSLLYFFMYDCNFYITFIVDNFRHAHTIDSMGTRCVNVLCSIQNISPMRSSFIFLEEREPAIDLAESLKGLYSAYSQNFVYGKDLLFDSESADYLFSNQEKWHNHKFDPKFKKKAGEVCFGDPSVLKYVATRALADNDFADSFVQESEVKAVYNLINTDSWLDNRFNKIVQTLGKESIEFLKAPPEFSDKIPTDFLVKTGLVSQNNTKTELLNPLLTYYIENNKEALEYRGYSYMAVSGAANFQSLSSLKELLTAKEFMVFKHLDESGGELVSKDEIAGIMWGANWEDFYSDWAIDKLTSNIRKKLEQSGYPKTLKSLKGQGVILV